MRTPTSGYNWTYESHYIQLTAPQDTCRFYFPATWIRLWIPERMWGNKVNFFPGNPLGASDIWGHMFNNRCLDIKFTSFKLFMHFCKYETEKLILDMVSVHVLVPSRIKIDPRQTLGWFLLTYLVWTLGWLLLTYLVWKKKYGRLI